MQERVIQAYDKLAKDYELHVDTDSGHNAYYERPAMMKLMPPDMEGMHVLDAGCAAGWYTEQYIKRGARVTAIDISPEMTAACKRRNGDRAIVLTCDLNGALPFEDASFDLIASSLTLHYVEDWAPVLREFRRILKPGGRFIFSTHHPFIDLSDLGQTSYFPRQLLSEVWNKKAAGPVEVSFYHRSMQDILNAVAASFVIERIVEPQPDEASAALPEAAGWFAKWQGYLSTRPHFLIVEARK
ncbi:methyltransferase domain-containing protein [Paenibacillus lycopersici]|uniref:Methyltransferase domain-containing protein n=1 Tax=Paenibacillus lycopersici TaxID=2704462 RepID=A0A6C0FYJ7_9BACL|nr:class I SAM-dependent methyltransferase [Paenibacillus lycopersici]QHT62188.1 methyltransferase domain-containing protein [Paenibacillus lycopersici]